MAVYKNTQGERYTLATMHREQRIAELEKTDDTVISLSCYWEDINRRWSIHHRELTTLIREIYEAGQWTRRFVSSLSV